MKKKHTLANRTSQSGRKKRRLNREVLKSIMIIIGLKTENICKYKPQNLIQVQKVWLSRNTAEHDIDETFKLIVWNNRPMEALFGYSPDAQ